uniref:Uncharacterized protein n=1 Tax=Anguilla anguilla TaxID=7936 RepID=A0A0E9TF68_ANGAN
MPILLEIQAKGIRLPGIKI